MNCIDDLRTLLDNNIYPMEVPFILPPSIFFGRYEAEGEVVVDVFRLPDHENQ